MHKNYAAWNIDLYQVIREEKNEEKLFSLFLHAGSLAPSTHNAQPWEFAISDHCIQLYSSPERLLPQTDPTGKLLAISMGTCIEAIVLAGGVAGYDVLVTLGAHTQPGDLFATLTFTKNEAGQTTFTPLLVALPSRRTNRFPYTEAPVDEQLIADMKQQAEHQNVTLLTFVETPDKEAIANVLLDSREALFDDPHFREEMATYKRSNMTRAYTGMPGFTMGFSFLASLLSPFIIRRFNVIKPIRAKEFTLLTTQTPLLCFIATKNNAQEDWCNAGRAYLHIALFAEAAGYATAISAAPREKGPLSRAMHTELTAQLSLRVGIATQSAGHSPRLPLAQLMRAKECTINSDGERRDNI